MRYINDIFTAPLGTPVQNDTLLPVYERLIERLPVNDEERRQVRDFVRFQLVGQRTRWCATPEWETLNGFGSRARAFERGAEEGIAALSERIRSAVDEAGAPFDAVLTATTTGNLMPGLSYRAARHLGPLVRPDSLLLDLGNVGCTGSSKALQLARSLDDSFRNILILTVELPTTSVDTRTADLDAWQGNCTFGDGAAAMWVSSDPDQGRMALALEEIRYCQRAETGLDLIHWGYHDYYRFALADEKTFNRDVQQFVAEALAAAEGGWKEEPRWAIHPAGIALLVRLARRLGIPSEAIQPSVRHYREYSNMSSASVVYVLNDLAPETPVGSAINLVTMGAGFNVIYGRVRRVR